MGNGLQEREVTFKIAKYLKDELEARNSNITVHLTHQGNFSAPTFTLSERANEAARLGADIVISLHINSSTSLDANGAEVYVTRDTVEDRYNKNCRLLGDLILGELSKLGIYNRGTKNSPVGNTTTPNDKEYYDSGIEVDYYGMIRYPRKLGIPGIIVEHCFISNAEDVQNFISTDEKIKNIAKADADAILEAVSRGYIVKKTDSSVIIYGDVNGDGRITASDYVLIKNYIMDPNTNPLSGVSAIAADVNKDGKITASDYVLIKNYIMTGTGI